MTKTLHILVGFPGTGKTTFRNSGVLRGSAFLSSDGFIERVAERVGKTYDQVFQETIKEATIFFEKALAEHLENETESIVIDRTNLTVKGRKRFLDLARKHGYETHAWDFNRIYWLAEDEWKNRLASRPGKVIPKKILESMIDSYAPPSFEEGFDSITFRR